MSDLRTAAEQALEFIRVMNNHGWIDWMLADYEDDAKRVVKDLEAALAEPPTNQCGETCERAKLCAVCARGVAEPVQEPVAWRWAVPKLRGVEWRYSLTRTRDDAQPLFGKPSS